MQIGVRRVTAIIIAAEGGGADKASFSVAGVELQIGCPMINQGRIRSPAAPLWGLSAVLEARSFRWS